MSQRNPYQLSKDYETLYHLISNGFEVIGFCPSDQFSPGRDRCLASCIRTEPWRISIGYPGRTIAGIFGQYDKPDDIITEQELFSRMCRSAKFEFIMPK